MEPVTALVVSAVVGVLANVGSTFLSGLIQRSKSRNIELTLPDGTKKTLHMDARATSAEVDQSVRRAVHEQKPSATSAVSDGGASG